MDEVATQARGDLFQVVAGGLYRMLARRMDFAPAAGDIEFTAQVMHDDIVKAGFTDAHAIAVAMDQHAQHDRRWPTPADIIDRLRGIRRTVVSIETARRISPPSNPEVAKRCLAMARASLKSKPAEQTKQSAEEARKELARRIQEQRYLTSDYGTMPSSTGGTDITVGA